MKKTDIIAAELKAIRERKPGLTVGFEDVPSYERNVMAELQKRLESIETDLDMRTCANFTHLGVECCPVCHVEYPEYELSIVEIESGGRAWLCCAFDRALNPLKHAARDESPEMQKLMRFFSDLSDSNT